MENNIVNSIIPVFYLIVYIMVAMENNIVHLAANISEFTTLLTSLGRDNIDIRLGIG